MQDVSRRSFVTGVGALGAAVGAAVSFSAVTGCTRASDQDTSATSVPYAVHETDVVVVGGGLAGMSAARSAMKSGARVMLVDKGRFGHSGDSGLNWGHQYAPTEFEEWDEEGVALGEKVFAMAYAGDGLTNQEQSLAVEQAFHDMGVSFMYEQIGGILERDKEGRPTIETGTNCTGFKPRVFAQHLMRMGLDVHDRTMVTDILQSPDGAVAGVVALDLKTGTPQVFRAKKVIFAVGTYVWAYGWNGMRAHTNGSPESTGECYSIMMRAGVPMANAEINETDQTQYEPLSLRNTTYTIGSQVTSWQYSLNGAGEVFSNCFADHPEAMAQGPFMRLTLKEVYEGRGTEHDGIYRDTTGDLIDTVELFWRRSKVDQYRELGYEVPDLVEVTPHYWNCGMYPADMDGTFETAVPGLYYAGQQVYAFTGCSFNSCMGTGAVAGACAAAAAAEIEMPGYDEDALQTALGNMMEPLTREGTGSRPIEVLRMIQDTVWEGIGLFKNEAGIQACITELERIRDEELPAMRLVDTSRCMNKEWQTALSLPGMIDCCLASAHASLVRTCSRGGGFVRTDYPELGDSLYNTKTTYADGEFQVETEPIVAVAADEQTLLAYLPRVSFANGYED